MNAALRAMGFPRDEVTGPGFRAPARTIMAEHLGTAESVMQAQLAHVLKDWTTSAAPTPAPNF